MSGSVAVVLLLAALAAAALGAIVGALFARGQAAARLGALSAQVAAGQAALDTTTRQSETALADAHQRAQTALLEAEGRAGASLADASRQVEALRAESAAAQAAFAQQRAALESEARSAQADAARLEALLDSERAASGDRATLLAQANEQLREAFGALSAEALRSNNEAFVQLAESRLGQARTAAAGDLDARQQAIDGIVAPLRETLTQVQAQLGEAERTRAGSQAALAEQIGAMRMTSEQLRTETAQLVTALRAPQVRGRWGELQLERALETAGLVEHVDYVTQATSSTEDGVVRPDAVVHLPGGKNVVLDSKVAFAGYLEAMEARDEATRANRLKAHARHMRDHIDSLGAKAYWQRFSPSPEFVVCFVPADAFLDAALREDPALLDHAFARNVVVATPSTLIALLRTVAYTWRQEALAANAAEVHKLGRELYQRLSTMGGHIDKLGRQLNGSVNAYNDAVRSLDSRVMVTARKMADLKVVEPGSELSAGRQVSELTTSSQAPELTEKRVVALEGGRGAGSRKAGGTTGRADAAEPAGAASAAQIAGQEDLLAAVGDDRLFGADRGAAADAP